MISQSEIDSQSYGMFLWNAIEHIYFFISLPHPLTVIVHSNYILDLLEGGRKLIVFGHHKSMLDSICESLTSKVQVHACPYTLQCQLY